MEPARPIQRDHVAALAVTALAASNVVANRLIPVSARVPWNLATTGLLLALAKAAGEDSRSLGLSSRRASDGWKHGAKAASLVAAAYMALLSNGRTRRLLRDERLLDLSQQAVVWRLLVGIPLGTAFAEEVAFRSVLPALLDSPQRPRWLAPALASSLFGLWHLLPSHDQMRANGTHSSLVGVSTLATAVGGGILHAVRHRAGHILAPITLHAATNAIGLIAVRFAGLRG